MLAGNVRKIVIASVFILATLWIGVGFVRARFLEARWNRDIQRWGPDAFGGVKREGTVTVEVDMMPLLVNPFQRQPTGVLKVNGVPRAVLRD